MALTDEAMRAIKSMISSGELRPGDRLPREAELAERLGLSRNSMREAIKALEVMRVVDVRHGDGTFITSLDVSVLLEAVAFVMDFQTDSSVIQQLEVRRFLEAAAVEMATQRVTDDNIAALYSMCEISDGATSEELIANDVAFHRLLADLSGNAYLAQLLDSLSSHTIRARIWRGISEGRAVQRTLQEHRQIVAAVASGNADVAKSCIVMHIANVEQWLRTIPPSTDVD